MNSREAQTLIAAVQALNATAQSMTKPQAQAYTYDYWLPLFSALGMAGMLSALPVGKTLAAGWDQSCVMYSKQLLQSLGVK